MPMPIVFDQSGELPSMLKVEYLAVSLSRTMLTTLDLRQFWNMSELPIEEISFVTGEPTSNHKQFTLTVEVDT